MNIFVKARFWSFYILCFAGYIGLDPKLRPIQWYVIFRIWRDDLLLSLLRMPMAWFSLVATWFICFNHSNWSAKKRTPRYFIMSFCVNLFPSSLNLRPWSVFLELEWKIINFVFLTLSDNLLALSHWDKFLR